MGLDMFLYGVKVHTDEDYKSFGEFEEVCYWRKFSALHKWFKDRFIKEGDPWGYYEVPEIDLQGLLLLCKFLKKIHENPKEEFYLIETDSVKRFKKEFKEFYNDASLVADILLPQDSFGCFFGSGIVDEWYWDHIDSTIEQLTEVLEEGYTKYFYMASW